MLGSADAKGNKFQKLANVFSLHTYCTEGTTLHCDCKLLGEYFSRKEVRWVWSWLNDLKQNMFSHPEVWADGYWYEQRKY